MGYLLHLLLALLAQGLAEAGLSTGWRLPGLVPILAGAPYALAWISRSLFLAGRFRSSTLVLRALSGCGPALHLVALSLFGWTECLGDWLGKDVSLAWPEFSLLLALLPFVVFELASIDARARVVEATDRERRSWRLFQIRMFLSGFVPLAAYVLITSAVGASETLRVEIEEVSLFEAALGGGLLLCLVLALPWLLRNVWDTSSLPPGYQRDVLMAVAHRAGFRARALLTWNTGDLMANAAIVGVGPRTRIVLFSDALLSQLDVSELAAVFAHEIGHAVRGHVLHFVVWAAAFFLLADSVADRLPPDAIWSSGGILVGAILAWFLVFGYVSRRCELEADLYCLELLRDSSALVGALEKVGGRLRDVASWRHFSTAERVRFLEAAAVDPDVGRRLHRTLRGWKLSGVALLVLAAGLQAWSLARSFPEDRLRADLRLGRYGAVSDRLAELHELEPPIAALAARAASLGRDGIPVSELERHARSSLSSADVESALAWLELGGLRGSREMEDVSRALRSMIDRGVDPEDYLEAPTYEAWRAELETVSRRRRGLSPRG